MQKEVAQSAQRGQEGWTRCVMSFECERSSGVVQDEGVAWSGSCRRRPTVNLQKHSLYGRLDQRPEAGGDRCSRMCQ